MRLDAGMPAPPGERLAVSVVAGRFFPEISAVPRGALLVLEGEGGALSEVAGSWGLTETAFRTSLAGDGDRFTFRLSRAGVLSLSSEQARGRLAYVYCVPHRELAVAGEDGRYALRLPPGRRRVTAWNPLFGIRDAALRIAPGENAHLDLFTIGGTR